MVMVELINCSHIFRVKISMRYLVIILLVGNLVTSQPIDIAMLYLLICIGNVYSDDKSHNSKKIEKNEQF